MTQNLLVANMKGEKNESKGARCMGYLRTPGKELRNLAVWEKVGWDISVKTDMQGCCTISTCNGQTTHRGCVSRDGQAYGQKRAWSRPKALLPSLKTSH